MAIRVPQTSVADSVDSIFNRVMRSFRTDT